MTLPIPPESRNDPTPEARLKRLRMRAWRRGTKEMDLILGPFADTHLADMPEAGLDMFEAVLAENDQNLYLWVTGHPGAPDAIVPMLAEIGAAARARLRPA
jgi:antitoxin CptB